MDLYKFHQPTPSITHPLQLDTGVVPNMKFRAKNTKKPLKQVFKGEFAQPFFFFFASRLFSRSSYIPYLQKNVPIFS